MGSPNPLLVFAADTNSYTLSRQSENIAAVRVEQRGSSRVPKLTRAGKSLLEGLATGETGFDIVPPLDVVAFVGFPTEENDAAVPH